MSEDVGTDEGRRARQNDGRRRAVRCVGRLRRGGARAVPLSRRRAHRGPPHADQRPSRLVRALRRRGRVRGRVATGDRQPLQGPRPREPDRSGWPRPSTKKVGSTTASTDAHPGRPPETARSPSRRADAMVDWALAERVASGALILKPAPASYRSRDLQAHFDELTARAESLVSEATGLHSAHGDGPGQGDRSARLGRRQRALLRAPGGARVDGVAAEAGQQARGPSLVVGRPSPGPSSA